MVTTGVVADIVVATCIKSLDKREDGKVHIPYVSEYFHFRMFICLVSNYMLVKDYFF